MESSVDAWMYKLQEELLAEFGERLVLLGLQGSRAREEARADSDIDIVVVIDGLDYASLQAYKEALSRMPNADLACGFVSSPQVLAGWPRYDSFNLFMDTSVYYGSFDFMDTDFTADDALDAAEAGASVIYHAICHGILFDGDALPGIVGECVKSAFFVMRALSYAYTGEYPSSRSRMKELASSEEKVFLDAYDQLDMLDVDKIAHELLTWSSNILAEGHN